MRCVTVLLGALVGHAAPHPREIQDDGNETEHNKMRISTDNWSKKQIVSAIR
jgi:hypothetical protein